MGALPVRLQNEPLLEAIWELRFSGPESVSMAEVLPGIIFQAMRDELTRTVRLPLADVPFEISQADQGLMYSPLIRLEGANPFLIQVGERMVSLNNLHPYRGWSEFSWRVRALMDILEETGLIMIAERFSIRTIDLLRDDGSALSQLLNVAIEVGSAKVSTQPMSLRTELRSGDFVQLVRIEQPVAVQSVNAQGVLVDIDTILSLGDSFWDVARQRLGEAHDLSKRTFFGLLSPSALEALGPVYQEGGAS